MSTPLGIPGWVAPFTGATTVEDAFSAKYTDATAPRVAIGIEAQTGAGTVTLRDARGETETFTMSADGSAGPAFRSFLFVEITAMAGVTAGKVYA